MIQQQTLATYLWLRGRWVWLPGESNFWINLDTKTAERNQQQPSQHPPTASSVVATNKTLINTATMTAPRLRRQAANTHTPIHHTTRTQTLIRQYSKPDNIPKFAPILAIYYNSMQAHKYQSYSNPAKNSRDSASCFCYNNRLILQSSAIGKIECWNWQVHQIRNKNNKSRITQFKAIQLQYRPTMQIHSLQVTTSEAGGSWFCYHS